MRRTRGMCGKMGRSIMGQGVGGEERSRDLPLEIDGHDAQHKTKQQAREKAAENDVFFNKVNMRAFGGACARGERERERAGRESACTCPSQKASAT